MGPRTPRAETPGGKQKLDPKWGAGVVPTAPQRPGDQFDHVKIPNGAISTRFSQLLMFFDNFSARGRPGRHGALRGRPWGAHGAHGRHIGAHGRPMGAHGRPWAPRGAPGAPHVLFLQGKSTKTIKNGLNGVEVAPFGLSLGRNGATGGAEPLALLPRPILGLFFFRGFRPSGPGAWGPGAPRRCAAGQPLKADYTGLSFLPQVALGPRGL